MAKKTSQAEVSALFARYGLRVIGVYENSFTPLESRCLTCKNLVSPRLDKVKLRGYRCSHCSGRANPAKKAEEVVREMGHTPLEPYKSALKPWKMKCGGCGKVISPKYNSIQQGNWGCGYCGHLRSGAKKRELGSKQAVKLMREAFCEPLVPYPGSHVPWKSRCMKCDSLVHPRLGSIKSGQGGCRKCGLESSAKTRMLPEKDAISRLKKLKLRPLETYPGTAKPWKCECLRCGSIVKPRLNYLDRSIYGCAVCAGTVVDEVAALRMMKKAKLTPQVKFPGSDKPWTCICNICKREVAPRYSSIKAGQGGCIWCVGKRVDPIVAVQTMKSKGLQPLEPFVSASAKWNCQCLRCLRKITTTYKLASTSAGGCKFCAPNYVNHEVILKTVEKAGYKPVEKYKNASTQWKVIHIKCGRTIKITYDSVRAGHNCKYCAGLYIDSDEAVQIMKLAGFQPLAKYPGARKAWRSKCLTCNRKVFPQLSSVKNRGTGCAYCAGNKVDIKDAKNFMLENGLTPLEVFPGAAKKWKCRCENCKRVVTPMYTSVRGGQGGCRFCADWGIDYGASGYLYLMTHKELSSHKIGIGNNVRSRGRSRIAQHQKKGWELFKQMNFEVTDDAYLLEQNVLEWLRKEKKLDVYLSESEMPQGGYSETVDASEITLVSIWAKVEELSKVKR